jgi:DNA-binding transcriptional LysR family regulator
MDWDLCRIFLSVAEARSFSAAARNLRESNPTVSRKIAALESRLGTRLFVRSTDGLVLTDGGIRFKQHAQEMALAALKCEAAVSAIGHAARGVVKLSVGTTLASHWLIPRLDRFFQEHEHIQLEVITHTFPASVRRLEADLILRPAEPGEENLVGRKIARVEIGLYASKLYAAEHPLPKTHDEWRDHRIIGFVDQRSNAELASWSGKITDKGTVVLRCSSQADMLAAVRAGHGICPLACFVASGYPELLRVAPEKLKSITDLWLLTHPDLNNLPAVRAVVDFLRKSAHHDRSLLLGRG